MTDYITLPKLAMNITGQKFGRLAALGPVWQNERKQIVWRCACDCGRTTDVIASSLRSGRTQSCGCLQQERTSSANATHGMTKTRIYKIWEALVRRCTVPGSNRYADYGGRGISVCDEWRDFQPFYSHVSQLPNYGEDGYTLDRIDNGGGYRPGNVRWTSRREQARNTRRNVMLTHHGKTQCVVAWAEELGMSQYVLHTRLRLGWAVDKALTTSVRQSGRKIAL